MSPAYHQYLDLMKHWKLLKGGLPTPYTKRQLQSLIEFYWFDMPEYEQDLANQEAVDVP